MNGDTVRKTAQNRTTDLKKREITVKKQYIIRHKRWATLGNQ